MNDVDFPVADVLDGIDAALAAGLAPVKVNMVVKRGMNERRHPRDGRALPRHRRDPALHRVHGRRRDERLAARRGRAVAPRSCARSTSAGRSSRSRPATAARSPRATATATAAARSASSRRSPSRSATTARARGSRPRASSTPACSRAAATTCARWCAASCPTPSSTSKLRGLWRVRDDRYSELRTQGTAARPAQGRDVAHRRLAPQRSSRARASSSSMRTCSRRVPSPTRAASGSGRCLSGTTLAA